MPYDLYSSSQKGLPPAILMHENKSSAPHRSVEPRNTPIDTRKDLCSNKQFI